MGMNGTSVSKITSHLSVKAWAFTPERDWQRGVILARDMNQRLLWKKLQPRIKTGSGDILWLTDLLEGTGCCPS